MPGARRVSDNDVKANRSISIRFSEDLLGKINNSWKSEGFANRTALIETACNLYFDTQACPRCHNRNHKNSLFCSICGNALNPLYELKNELNDYFLYLKEKQEKALSLERELADERSKLNERILSMNLSKPLESGLLSMIRNQGSQSDTGSLETAIKNSKGHVTFYPNSITHPLFDQYSEKLIVVNDFFSSKEYATNNPQLFRDQAKDVRSCMLDLDEILRHYQSNVLEAERSLIQSIHEVLDGISNNVKFSVKNNQDAA